MRILIKTADGRIQRPLRLLVAHHARRTLQGLRDFVPRVVVSLSEVGEPNGGLDKRCVVEMKAGGVKTVMTSVSKTWRTAIRLALRDAADRLRAVQAIGAATRTTPRLPLLRRPTMR